MRTPVTLLVTSMIVCSCGQTQEVSEQSMERAGSEPAVVETSVPPDCAPSGAQADLPATYRGTLRLVPNHASVGGRFRAHFRNRKSRGGNLFMSSGERPPCQKTYLLTSDGSGEHWTELPHTGEFGIVDAPTRRASIPAVVPTTADPGTYRVCDIEAVACALLRVTK